MSAGKFDLTFYQTDLGKIIPIKIQPETAQATFGGSINIAPGGAATTPDAGFPSAMTSRSRRSIGIHARTIQVNITSGLPTGYKPDQTYSIPVLSQSVYDNAVKGQAAGYLGGTGKIVSKTSENIV